MDDQHVAFECFSQKCATHSSSDHPDGETKQDVEKVELSSSEISFAFLLESHAFAIQILNDLVVRAANVKHSNTWKHVLCSYFS